MKETNEKNLDFSFLIFTHSAMKCHIKHKLFDRKRTALIILLVVQLYRKPLISIILKLYILKVQTVHLKFYKYILVNK